MFNLSEKDIARFWSKIEIGAPDECWEWGAKSRHWNGYGLFTLANGKKGGIKIVASRISCYIAHGAAPEGLTKALHSCDNPPCCNPAHLRWGTQKHNVADAKQRDRHVNPPSVRDNPEWEAKRIASMRRGEGVPNQSLKEPQVREIWRLHMMNLSVPHIAATLDIKKYVVADVCRGRSWRHLDGAPSIEELKSGGVRRGHNQFS